MLICQRHQTILRVLSSAAMASTPWRVRELNCPTAYLSVWKVYMKQTGQSTEIWWRNIATYMLLLVKFVLGSWRWRVKHITLSYTWHLNITFLQLCEVGRLSKHIKCVKAVHRLPFLWEEGCDETCITGYCCAPLWSRKAANGDSLINEGTFSRLQTKNRCCGRSKGWSTWFCFSHNQCTHQVGVSQVCMCPHTHTHTHAMLETVSL